MISPRFLLGKRKREFDESLDEYLELSKRRTKKRLKEMEGVPVLFATMSAFEGKKKRKKRVRDIVRNQSWWGNGFRTWHGVTQNSRRGSESTERRLLSWYNDCGQHSKKTTNAKPNPTSVEKQVASTPYRYAHGVSFHTIGDLFGISKELACTIFNKTSRAIVFHLYDEFVKLPTTEDEWQEELKGFIENYGFPCVAAWDGFHIYVSTRLKQFYSFKKRYTVTNMGVVSYSRRFLYAAVGPLAVPTIHEY